MNQLAKDWVTELRSDKYKQGRYLLKAKLSDGSDAYCCLGVACELMKDQLEIVDLPDHTEYNKHPGSLPIEARKAYKLANEMGRFRVTENLKELPISPRLKENLNMNMGYFTSLSRLNDNSM